MKSSTKFVLAATVFNLLAEYAFRGFGRIVTDPIQIIYLFIVYYAYFCVVKDLLL